MDNNDTASGGFIELTNKMGDAMDNLKYEKISEMYHAVGSTACKSTYCKDIKIPLTRRIKWKIEDILDRIFKKNY